jgi:hypothetical protein
MRLEKWVKIRFNEYCIFNWEAEIIDYYTERDSEDNIKLSFLEFINNNVIHKVLYEPDMWDNHSCDYDDYDIILDNDFIFLEK